MIVSFDTDAGLRSHSFEVLAANTMLEVLPMIMKSLTAARFDWDLEWDDYRDKLSIFYGNAEYTKLDKKLRQILPLGKDYRTV